MRLSWSTYEVHGACVLALAGGLCAEAVLMVDPEVARLLAGDRSVLVIDLAEVQACDSAGVEMPVGAARAGQRHVWGRRERPGTTDRSAATHAR
ncbi:STAS domain-containing protein [Planosporangium flavigriseum]|uniref:STAS domain-containing protein n=1 Tax=Planosporangium flavigriseum TaxID=373681 RepID=UPI003B849091